MNNEVKYAVIPCAGKGTRFLPITKGVPKEMLNIIDTPTLDYIVDELIAGGITNIIFVISKDKDDIKKYYDRNIDFENDLIANKKEKYAEIIKKNSTKARFEYCIQHEQLGLGHAVLCAKDLVKNNNFVVCCGDDITTFQGKAPIKELIEAFEKTSSTIVGGQKVPHQDINKYGSMEIEKDLGDGLLKLSNIVEKPDVDKAPSDYASLGKWVFKPNIFTELEHTPKGKGGEIQLTDAIALLMKKEDVYFKEFHGKRYDCGDKLGFLKAIIDVALDREDLGKDLLNYLKEKVK